MQSEQLAPTLAPETAAEGSYYLEQPAKRSNVLKDIELQKIPLKKNLVKMLNDYGYSKEAFRLSVCGQKWRHLDCSIGHGGMFKRIVCALPYCPECGKVGSWLNKRRAKRVRDILLGFPALGNYVFTLPKELSGGMPDSNKINKLYKLAWSVLRDWLNAEAAVIILHFCGDKSNGLHLHFDCSFPILHSSDCSYPLDLLKMARAHWTSGVNEIFGVFLFDTVGHYEFDLTLEQQLHWTNYATRSTMPAEKFIELPEAQKRYCLEMNSKKIVRYFGGFDSRNKKEFLAKHQNRFVFEMIEANSGDQIDRCVCPICGEKMRHRRYNEENWVWMDDIPLSNFVRHDRDTFISREIAIWLEQQECRPDRGDFARLEDYLLYKDLGLALDRGPSYGV